MKKLFVALLVLSSSMMFGQIAKTGGLLYSNGNPNTRGIDTLVTKNLSKNSEVCIDYTTGTIYTFNRSDSSFVKYDARPYKVYTALLTQTGTSAPVATVLENTIGDTISFAYVGVGSYKVTSTSLFTANKTTVFIGNMLNDGSVSSGVIQVNGFSVTTSEIEFATIDNDGTPANSNEILLKTLIEIRVYD